jgi:IS605 OrfB family transposase
MRLVERHKIKIDSIQGKLFDANLFLSKNLYNSALYAIRQHYFSTKTYLKYLDLQKQFQNEKQKDYIALPASVSQQVLMYVDKCFKSFFAALKSYKKNPSIFKSRPKLPNYKDKISGRNLLIYTYNAFSKKKLKLHKTNYILPTKLVYDQINQVRIIPGSTHHIVEIIYEKEEKSLIISDNYAAIDLGIANLATITYNKKSPQIISGGPLKSINQFYNKKKALLQSQLKNRYMSKKIKRLTNKRNDKIADYMHKASRYITNQLVSNNISKLIIGYNKNWKQEVNIGKKNNQNFTSIPYLKFINMLQYKCKLEGIEVILNEESYTSKCSFLDLESIEKHEIYKGRRIHRGLFKSAENKLINADVNASYNIMRKAIPGIFNGIEVVAVQPIRIKTYKNLKWK